MRPIVNVEILVKDSFVMAKNPQVPVPNYHSPVARKETDSGIEQLACKVSVRASAIM